WITFSDIERLRLDFVAKALRERNCASLTSFRNGDDEFVAAITRDRIDTARGTRQQERDFDEHLVPSEMAVGIVHFLECVDVEHQDAERRVVATGALDLCRQ